MQITVAGFILLPLLAVIALLRQRWLVAAVVLLAPLPSVSVVTVSAISFGLQPSAAAGMFLIGSVALSLARRGPWAIEASGAKHIMPLLVLAGWAFVSGQLLPRLFRGTLVRNADGDFVELSSGLLHITQFGYLLFGVLIAVAVLTTLRTPQAQSLCLWSLVASGWIAFALGVLQIREADTPTFLTDILFNNPGFDVLATQRIGGSVRMSSTLIEPSVAAVFFGGYAAAVALMLVEFRGRTRVRWYLAASLVMGMSALFLTRATTGFIAAGAVVLLLVWSLGRSRRSVEWLALGLLGTASVAVAITVALRTGYLSEDNGVVEAVSSLTTEKSGTESAEERLAGEELAWDGFRSSFGMGLGWGSSRAYSLLSTIMANLGVIGMVIVGWVGLRLRRLNRWSDQQLPRRELRAPMQAFTIAAFTAAMFSAPDITFTFFWVPIGAWVAATLPFIATTSPPSGGTSVVRPAELGRVSRADRDGVGEPLADPSPEDRVGELRRLLAARRSSELKG